MAAAWTRTRGAAAGGEGRSVLRAGDVTMTPQSLAALPGGSVVQINWSGDRGIFGAHGLNNGGTLTLWVLDTGAAEWGGMVPAFCQWSCVGGVITLWMSADNVQCRFVVEKIK